MCTQLNQQRLLTEMCAVGFSEDHAHQVLDQGGKDWEVCLVPSHEQELTVHVFRPDCSTPVLTAQYQDLYKKVAQHWKAELNMSKSLKLSILCYKSQLRCNMSRLKIR